MSQRGCRRSWDGMVSVQPFGWWEMNIAAVRTRYDHIQHRWRRDTAERRAALIGELHLLVLQLPVVDADDPDREKAAGLRADLLQLITEISTGQPTPITGRKPRCC